jgi:ABC-type metal ion transport system substrate-binding protein
MSSTDTRPATPDTGGPEFRLGGRGRRWQWIAVLTLVVAVVVAVVVAKATSSGGSGSRVAGSHFGTTLQIAYEADSGSERAFLDYLDKDIAPSYGVSIKAVGIGDGNQLDQATASGQLAANIYQHKHWLKQVVDKTGWKLTAVGPVFQWAYSVYSSKHTSLDQIPHGGTIALLNDPANTAQALWLLQRAGKLTFKPGVNPWEATVNDIASNPNGYKFTFIDYGAGPRVLDEVDAVIAYNFQFISAGVSQRDKIYAPPAPREFAGQLVVGTRYLNDPQIKKLERVFFDPRVQKYLATTNNPALKDQLSPVSST